jgi:peptidyl-prolyl cis-trans isomerase SurA
MILYGNKINILGFIVIIILAFFSNDVKSVENKIELRINNEIITTLDLQNEIIYNKLFNKSFNNLEDKNILKISKNFLINEKIKKLEIINHYKEMPEANEYIDNIIENNYKKMGINTYDEFLDLLKNNNLDIKKIKNKINISFLWKRLIFSKFNNKLKIDEKKIQKEISENIDNKIKTYFLSEILFNASNNDKLIKKTIEIQNSIIKIGFEKTALIYSTADSSKDGGKLNWIRENSLNKKIREKLNIMSIGEVTKPIITPGGFLILKIEDIKLENRNIDLNEELKKIINIEKNKQLVQYSNIYFNKIKKNYQINEN